MSRKWRKPALTDWADLLLLFDAKRQLHVTQKHTLPVVKKIAVLFRDWSTRRYDAIRGISDFARTTSDWRLVVPDQVRTAADFRDAGRCDFDGILTCLDGAPPEVVSEVEQFDVPLVNVGTALVSGVSISVNARSIARMVAHHLADANLTSLAFIATSGQHRLASELTHVADEHGWTFHHVETELEESLLVDPIPRRQLCELLDLAEAPLGIVTSCDLVAVGLRRLAERIDIDLSTIPIIAARDSFLCAMPEDSITAIVEPTYELGRDAARILNNLLQGHPASSRSSTIDATEVRVRLSTSPPERDRVLCKAKTFIQENACRGIRVSDVVAHLQVSRVTFERRFRAAFGVSPGESIRFERLNVARRLLQTTNHPISEIATACGFDAPSKFSTFFKNGTQITPTEYRESQ